MNAIAVLVVIAILPLAASAQNESTRIPSDVFLQSGVAQSKSQSQSAQRKVEQADLDPRQELARQLIETDLADNVEKLTKLANLAHAYGAMDYAARFSDMAQQAKTRGEIKTFQSLMIGNVDGAIDAAKLSGNPFADRPVKLHPNNPNDHQWKVMYAGSPETVIDAKSLFEMYSQLAKTSGIGTMTQQYQADQERKTRMELVEKQKRALEEQRTRSPTSELRDNLIINELLGPRF